MLNKVQYDFFFNLDSKVGDYLPLSLQGGRELLSFPSPSEFFASQNNTILSESRHYSTSFCFLLNVKEDLNGLPGYISPSLSLLKSSSVSHNRVVTMYTEAYFFHL